ncbi:antibiotic biosynthesis monooxygenase [Flavobacterium psychroterrae]|uniref:Antibiotic biosynthesis monooxygenase n=1 Tax=Flavobacterium psychroterrae TaxID=2133767 RepID=A0ABS5PGT3_9FLAO|nr:antibiotic biosynthesis monooxygenase family protein [Flavobacterium psychroterrae]MBS7233456.1 antibiotic biosynthesis monooxygenase [Flavobacterium psychroterrae]
MTNFTNIIFGFKKTAMAVSMLFLFQISMQAQQAKGKPEITKDQLVLSIKFKTTPENAAKFKSVLTNLFDTISHEKNFVEATLHQELGKPEEFLVYEVWNDNIDHFLNVQMKSPYAVEYEKVLKEMNVERSPAAYTAFGHWTKK